MFCCFWKLLLACFSTSVSFYLLINYFLRSDVCWHCFQWGTWLSLGFNSFSSSIFFLIGYLISMSFFFCKLRTAVVDFLAFVTPIGVLSLNALLVCLSIEKNWTRSCMHSGTASLMVSLTSSPWNDYCSAESFISALCPSVMLAWYSWVSAITIVFPSLIASLISLSASLVVSAVSPWRQLLIQSCLELLHLDPGTLKCSFLQKFGQRQTTPLDSHWGQLRAETFYLEHFILPNTLLSFHWERNISSSKPFITDPQVLAFHRNRT